VATDVGSRIQGDGGKTERSLIKECLTRLEDATKKWESTAPEWFCVFFFPSQAG
jgi:hypothetical protein